ncbi:MAG: hypothetical protein ACLFTL_08690 [Alphaproteobacteria bacterium]
MTATDEPAAPGHLQAPFRELADAATVCRLAARALDSADAAGIVSALAGIHERDLAHLRRLRAKVAHAAPEAAGATPVDDGMAGERARAARGRVQLAHSRDGDRAVLAIVRETQERVSRVYERMRDDLALPGEFRTLAGAALEELHRRHRRLEAAMRLAG